MKDADLIVTMTVSELRALIRAEVDVAIAANQPRPKLTYDTREAAVILNVPETWLAAAARDGRMPSIKLGHYVRFKLSDLEQFLEKKAS